jgi:hypothetical protein
MFSWYKSSLLCYVYLSDVVKTELKNDSDMLHRSRWFTRGWTLQELLAPTYVIFYDKNWLALGTRPIFAYELHKITSIDEVALGRNPPSLNTFCVARRMSWAAKRTTTREEDMAYSLLGLFDINMPLLYGEGMRAFTRLQEEIIKKSNDDSILAWGLNAVSSTSEPKPTPPMPGLISSTTDSAMQPSPYNTVLAPSPTDFKGCQSLSFNATAGFPFTLTNVGLQVEMLCIPLPSNSDFNDCISILDCELDSQPDFVGIPLFQSGPDSPGHHTKYIRGVAVTVTPRLAAECSLRQFTIVTERKMVGSIQHVSDRHRVLVTLSEDSQRAGLRIAHGEEVPIEFFSDVSAYTSQWDPATMLLWTSCSRASQMLFRFQIDSWDRKPGSACTLFARAGAACCLVEKGVSFAQEKLGHFYYVLGRRHGETDAVDSDCIDWQSNKVQLVTSVQWKSVHDWHVHEVSIDIRRP